MSENEFSSSQVTYDACVLNFINIGEQVKLLSTGLKEKYPAIPYRKIIGLRNIAAHSYEGLEPFRLFKVIREDVPEIYGAITKIIEIENFHDD